MYDRKQAMVLADRVEDMAVAMDNGAGASVRLRLRERLVDALVLIPAETGGDDDAA